MLRRVVSRSVRRSTDGYMVAEIGVWGLHVLSTWDLDCEESAEKSRGTGVMFWDTWERCPDGH